MPSVPQDAALLTEIQFLVAACRGNQSEAARRLGTSRLTVNRILKQDGHVTEPKRLELWAALRKAKASPDKGEGEEAIHDLGNIRNIALQVIQFLASAVETFGDGKGLR